MCTFRRLLFSLFLLSTFLTEELQANAVIRGRLASCRFTLATTYTHPTLKQAYIGYIDRLKVPGGTSRSSRIRVMEDFARDPLMLEAVRAGDRHATDILTNLVETNGDAEFRRAIRPHLAKFEGWDAVQLLQDLDNSNAPDAYARAENFPKDAFSDTPSEAAKNALKAFASNNANVTSRMFTRRVFSFMAENKGMSVEDKVNFCNNLVSSFHELQKEQVPKDELLVFEHKKNADGLDVFCGHRCAYYFVIDNDSNFYSAQSQKNFQLESWPEVHKDWRGAARFIYKAGQEAPEK